MEVPAVLLAAVNLDAALVGADEDDLAERWDEGVGVELSGGG